MTELKNELGSRLSEMKYGEIQTIPMIDRGPYRDLDANENLDSTTGASKRENGILAELAPEITKADEDFISVQRANSDVAMNPTDFDWYFQKLTTAKHLIFVNCLELSTSEIKSFLLALKEKELLKSSKIFLLDLPQLEYLMLRDSLADKISL